MSTAVGASLVAHGLHYAMVLAGLWGLGALLLPHVLDPYARDAGAHSPLDEHDVRVSALRATVAAGTLTTLAAPYDAGTTSAATSGTTSLAAPGRPRVAAVRGLPLALVGSATAAGLHAAVAPPHFRESPLFGAFFLVVALVQLAWAAALLHRPTIDLLHLGVAINLGLVTLWGLTRTLGLPFGLLPVAEPVGGWDIACVLWEMVVVTACLHTLRDGLNDGLNDGVHDGVNDGVHSEQTRFPGWFSWHPSSRAAVGAAAVSLVLLTVVGSHS